MKSFYPRGKKSIFPLLKKTIRSYSDNEKAISLVLIVLMLLSGWRLVLGNWAGQNLFTLLSGGHSYSEGMIGSITRLNPVYADLNEVDKDITSLIFEGLSKYDPEQKKVVENIATHTLDESKKIYTFTLKEGIAWQDGQPVTADDVYYTYHDVIQSPDFENPILKSIFLGENIEKVDEKTIKMTLQEPNSFFFTQLTVGLLPQHILKEVPIKELDSNEFNQLPIGNGPYQVISPYEKASDESTSVTLEYSENYWKKADPEVTEINFLVFPSYEKLIDAKGQIHGIARIPEYKLEESQEDRFTTYEYSLPQYTALFINTNKTELAKRNVRLGIQKGIDKNAILNAIGYTQAIDTPLLELNQGDWIYQPNKEEAAGALFDSGWPLNSETGLRTNSETGEVLSFKLIRRSYPENEKQEEVNEITARMIAEQLGQLGIQVTVENYENEPFQKKVQERDYDLLLYGQSLGYNLDTYSYWHSSQINENGLNLSNYTNAKADFSIEIIRTTFDDEEEKKQESLKSLAEIIKNDIPAVFLYRPSYYFLADNRIQNIRTENLLFPLDRFANILDWKIE